jgi:hypothetical protein
MPDTTQTQKGKIPIAMLDDSFVIPTASDSCGYNKQGVPDSKKIAFHSSGSCGYNKQGVPDSKK